MQQRLQCVLGSEPTATVESPPEPDAQPDVLLEEAAQLGFELVSYQTESDQTVWEWRQGDGPRPQFVAERVARQWMAEWLARQPDLVQPEPLEDRRRSRDGSTGTTTTPSVAESA
jgi:hypothetical protein